MTTQNNSKKTNIIYWIFTSLLIIGMLFSAIPGMIGTQQAVTFMSHLGYPSFIPMFLGIAKILAIIAILIPGYPRIKEWAYAGLTFDLTGATFSLIAIGTPAGQVAFMIIWFAILAGSYIYYHKKLKAATQS